MNVTIHPVSLPPRRGHGRKARVTELTKVEVWSWYLAKQHLGTIKSKARELGLTEGALRGVIGNLKRQARNRGRS